MVHFFKEENATNPYKTRSLRDAQLFMDKDNSPTVVDRKTNEHRKTFGVKFMQTDGKAYKSFLYTVPQKAAE